MSDHGEPRPYLSVLPPPAEFPARRCWREGFSLSPRWNRRLFFLLAIAFFAACGPIVEGDNPEVVLMPGMRLDARTPEGSIAVVALSTKRRRYIWDGCQKDLTLYARNKRWYGSLGLYYPGAGITWWIPCDGINRAVAGEGQQHFASIEDALVWLHSREPTYYVFRNDGLVAGWSRSPERTQINVDIWQILINGERPTRLRGANDNSIRVSRPTE